jgi:hypothetical protein
MQLFRTWGRLIVVSDGPPRNVAPALAMYPSTQRSGTAARQYGSGASLLCGDLIGGPYCLIERGPHREGEGGHQSGDGTGMGLTSSAGRAGSRY